MEATIYEGVEVYSCDGKKLGKVKHLFSAAAEPSPDQTGETVDQSRLESPASLEAAEEHELSADLAMERVGAVNDAGGAPYVSESSLHSGWVPSSGAGAAFSPSATKYFEVHHGGLLHVGGESLYVPFDAVEIIETDDSIVLRYTADEAAAYYAQKPAALDPD
jgi:hypothetical protein